MLLIGPLKDRWVCHGSFCGHPPLFHNKKKTGKVVRRWRWGSQSAAAGRQPRLGRGQCQPDNPAPAAAVPHQSFQSYLYIPSDPHSFLVHKIKGREWTPNYLPLPTCPYLPNRQEEVIENVAIFLLLQSWRKWKNSSCFLIKFHHHREFKV